MIAPVSEKVFTSASTAGFMMMPTSHQSHQKKDHAKNRRYRPRRTRSAIAGFCASLTR